MATWSRRFEGGAVQVFKKKVRGHATRVPRNLYKHLDGQPDHVIDAWVRDYETKFEGKNVTPDHLLIGTLKTYVEDFLKYLAITGLEQNTVDYHRLCLQSYAVPFFLDRVVPLRDVGQWPGVSVKMLEYLAERGVNPRMIRRVNQTLMKFWNWMRDEGLVNLDLRLRNPANKPTKTPLKYTLSPADALKLMRDLPPQLRMFALCGYFFSLRPQETFALTKGDFRAGSSVLALECSKTLARVKLYSRFAVKLKDQRDAKDNVKELKTASSAAWVGCFNEEAAKLVVKTISELGDDVWFPHGYRYYSLRWEETWPLQNGLSFTFKDLRRASLYWLGHNTELTAIELMKHARHVKLETTMLYLRRPDEIIESPMLLDLEA